MTTTPDTGGGYDIEGTLLEACDCGVLCPCWIGEDPDNGDCHSFIAYHFDRGTIRGVDVAGLNFVRICHIPGNVLVAGSWQTIDIVDERADDAQAGAILDAYGGRLGGPLADLAGLIGRTLETWRAPIVHEVRDGRGTLRVDGALEADMHPYTGPDGRVTTLRDSVFSTVPGSPAYVAVADRHEVHLPEHGFEWSLAGRNAIQSDYRIVHAG